ncbi:MAG: DUF6110 family protein [archaeon]|nr:DUF6110 family protein [archaeon]
MVKIEDIMEHKKTLIFVGGMATALIGKKILESQTTKDFCSRSMAKVIAMKTDAEASIQDIKDNAEDIYASSVEENKEKIYIESSEEE